ncbi:hypothetical protein BZA77DRAFT_246412 [Pyronema omphalodes]|nr:hypothetical protein BZA77DRAFT_246412 [Pyronema omphalodes]
MSNPINWHTGALITEIKLSELDLSDIEVTEPRITEVEYLASYNWLENKPGTILVPGSPPAWAPQHDRKRALLPDSGTYYRDPNGARWPRFPMEPAVRSLLHLAPSLDRSSINLVACSSTLENLLYFAGSLERSFRFDVDLVGGTVFFIRRENSPNEKIEDAMGYRHTYPEANTTWDPEVGGSASHHRLVRYEFGGINVVVRTETDGYLPDKLTSAPEKTLGPSPRGGVGMDTSGFPLHDMALLMSAGESTSGGDKLKIEFKGRAIPQEAIFDLKTRPLTTYRPLDRDELIRWLWVNQTPNFVFAQHERGVFEEPKIENIGDEMRKWEKDNVNRLRRFQAVLTQILDTALDWGECVQVVRCGNGPLEIQTQSVGEEVVALPFDLRAEWTSVIDAEEDDDEEWKELDEQLGYFADTPTRNTYHEDDDDDIYDYRDNLSDAYHSDRESERDYTACSAEDCGYCGRCGY